MHSASDCWTLEVMDDLKDTDPKSNVLSLAMEVHRRLAKAYVDPASWKSIGDLSDSARIGRVANRLGLDQASRPNDFDAAQVVPHDWSFQDIETFTLLLDRHGERCCYERFPACERCPLIDLCPTGISNMRERDLGRSPEKSQDASHDFMFPL